MNNKTILPILLTLITLTTLIPATMTQAETSTQYKLELLWVSEDQRALVYGLDWSPDGKYIAIGTESGYLKIYDANTGEYLWGLSLGEPVQVIDWSPDGKYIAATSHNEQKVFVVDTSTHRIAWSKKSDPGTCGVWYPATRGVAWDPSGGYLAVGIDHCLYLFNRNGEQLWRSECQPDTLIFHIAWSHRGDKIAFEGGEGGDSVIVYSHGGVKLWEHKTGGKITSVDWSPDDKYLAAGSKDHRVYVFDENGVLLWSRDMENEVYGVAWDPSGGYLAVSGSFGTALFTRNGEQLWIKKDILTGWSYYVHGKLEWNRYGYLAVGGTKLYIIDRNGNLIASSENHWIDRATWSPIDQTRIAVDGYKKLYVWRLVRWTSIVRVEPSDARIKVCFSGLESFCETIHIVSREYSLAPGTYTVSYELLEPPPNTVGDASNYNVSMRYMFEPEKNYTILVPGVDSFLARIRVSNPLDTDVTVRFKWGGGYRDYRIGCGGALEVYAVPETTYQLYVLLANNTWMKTREIRIDEPGTVQQAIIPSTTVSINPPDTKIEVCFTGPISLCDTVISTQKEYKLLPGTYTVSFKLLETPTNTIGDLYSVKITKQYVFKQGKTYILETPPLEDFLGILKFVNSLPISIDVVVSWSGGNRVFVLSNHGLLDVYAVPGRYRIQISSHGDIIGDTSALRKTLNVDVIAGESPVVYRIDEILSGFGVIVFKNPLSLPINVEVSWGSSHKTFKIPPSSSVSLYATFGQYSVRWSIMDAVGYNDKLSGTGIVSVDDAKTYVFTPNTSVGMLRLVNGLDVPCIIRIVWDEGSKEFIIGGHDSLTVYLAAGEYKIFATPNYRYLVDKYVGSRTINVEANSAIEADLGDIVPISKIILRGVPGARYKVSGGNIIAEGVLPGKGEETLFMPPGDISIHAEPLDIFHAAIECSINAKPGKVILVDVSKYPYGLFFYILLGLAACGLYGSFYAAVMKPRLSIVVSRREIIRSVDEKIRIKVSNKGLIDGEFSIAIDVDGRRVFEDRISLRGRETRWIDIDLTGFIKQSQGEDRDEQA